MTHNYTRHCVDCAIRRNRRVGMIGVILTVIAVVMIAALLLK